MCGICGFAGRGRDAGDEAAIGAMNEAITHRGPEGTGAVAFDGPVHGWLGHNRLRIIDVTEAAHQPMASDDGRIQLTYNGEVYNFRELRSELSARGHRFTSSGDTEVVLRAYEEWGEAFLRRIDGMFAIALWDGRRGRLLLARDRTGKKPLFYSLSGDRLTFGSEIKALRAAPWVQARADLTRVRELLTFGYVPHPGTMYEDIVQVPPAGWVTYDADGLHGPFEYWNPVPDRVERTPADTLAEEVRALVTAAVEKRLIADVPLGAFLSGGIDSSVVVGLMARASAEPVRTFAIGFPDEPSFDERSHARVVADHFGTRHTEFAVRADAVALLDRLLWHHDQPFADSSAIPTYLVSQLAREHVTVVLTGDGGDEVFAGYERFAAARVGSLIPRPVGAAGRRLAARLPRDHGYFSVRRRAERFFADAELPLPRRYQGWISVTGRELLHDLAPGDGALMDSMELCHRRTAHLPMVDQILYANFRTYLPDDLAVKMDRMSMAHSLEARAPFLDTTLIERLARVPGAQKIGLRQLKPLLREAFAPLLPEAIWNRRKHGFGVPMGKWFREDLGEVLTDEVLAHDARTRDLLDRPTLERLWTAHRAGERDHGPQFWTILTLERWLRSLEHPQAAQPPAVSALVS
jgi:asparagine synthase (glutamine-hydrolysing)